MNMHTQIHVRLRKAHRRRRPATPRIDLAKHRVEVCLAVAGLFAAYVFVYCAINDQLFTAVRLP